MLLVCTAGCWFVLQAIGLYCFSNIFPKSFPKYFFKSFYLRLKQPKYRIKLNAEKDKLKKKTKKTLWIFTSQFWMFSLCHHQYYYRIIIIILWAFHLVSFDSWILSMGAVKDARWDLRAKKLLRDPCFRWIIFNVTQTNANIVLTNMNIVLDLIRGSLWDATASCERWRPVRSNLSFIYNNQNMIELFRLVNHLRKSLF